MAPPECDTSIDNGYEPASPTCLLDYEYEYAAPIMKAPQCGVSLEASENFGLHRYGSIYNGDTMQYPASVSFFLREDSANAVEPHQVPGFNDYQEYLSPEALGYEQPQDTHKINTRAARRGSRRHSVGDGLVPRRGSLTRSDCRESNGTLAPGLQFSRRNSLSRSDNVTIPVVDEDDTDESPQRYAVRRRSSMEGLLRQMATAATNTEHSQERITADRRPSMAPLVNRTSNFVKEQAPKVPERRGSSRRMSMMTTRENNNENTPSRGVTRWSSMEALKNRADAKSSPAMNATPPMRHSND